MTNRNIDGQGLKHTENRLKCMFPNQEKRVARIDNMCLIFYAVICKQYLNYVKYLVWIIYKSWKRCLIHFPYVDLLFVYYYIHETSVEVIFILFLAYRYINQYYIIHSTPTIHFMECLSKTSLNKIKLWTHINVWREISVITT